MKLIVAKQRAELTGSALLFCCTSAPALRFVSATALGNLAGLFAATGHASMLQFALLLALELALDGVDGGSGGSRDVARGECRRRCPMAIRGSVVAIGRGDWRGKR